MTFLTVVWNSWIDGVIFLWNVLSSKNNLAFEWFGKNVYACNFYSVTALILKIIRRSENYVVCHSFDHAPVQKCIKTDQSWKFHEEDKRERSPQDRYICFWSPNQFPTMTGRAVLVWNTKFCRGLQDTLISNVLLWYACSTLLFLVKSN